MRNDRAMDLERCVFHARSSRNASADELTSLSALAFSNPDAYADALSKYDDTPERRRLRDTWIRSEEHTSELQSRGHLVCRLLLEKKKTSKLSETARRTRYIRT